MKKIRIEGPPKSGKTKLLIDIANTLHIAGDRVTFVGEQSVEVIRRMGLKKTIPYRTVRPMGNHPEHEHLQVHGG